MTLFSCENENHSNPPQITCGVMKQNNLYHLVKVTAITITVTQPVFGVCNQFLYKMG